MPDRRIAMDELIRGREVATRLRILLYESSTTMSHGPDSSTTILIDEVLGSFSRALSALYEGEKLEMGHHRDSTNIAPSPDDRRNENYSTVKPKVHAARRGAYRRRAHPYLRTRTTSEKLDDGHSWRKYGQKTIYCSKFPRSYYRCTHKNDQGCQATKHVQQSEDDPSLFIITYMGEHTCKDLIKAMASHPKTPYLISFGSSNTPPNMAESVPPFSPFTSLKQDTDEEALSNLTTFGSPSDDHLGPPEVITAFANTDDGNATSRLNPSELDFIEHLLELNVDHDELSLNFFLDSDGLDLS